MRQQITGKMLSYNTIKHKQEMLKNEELESIWKEDLDVFEE